MKPDDINDHPALLIYETNIPVNTYACNSVIMPITLAKNQTVLHGVAEQFRFPAHHARRGAGHGDRLRGDHLASYAAAGICCHQQCVRDVDLLRRGRLQ